MPSNNEGERVRERHQERQTETQILTPVVSWSAAIKQAVWGHADKMDWKENGKIHIWAMQIVNTVWLYQTPLIWNKLKLFF